MPFLFIDVLNIEITLSDVCIRKLKQKPLGL
jgi:hypothetical protein